MTLLTSLILLLTVTSLALSAPSLSTFHGTWEYQSLYSSSLNAVLRICHDDLSIQARYTENGNTIGFLHATNESVLSTGTNQLRLTGTWYEAGQHHGTFEMNILDSSASPLQAQFYIWYHNQYDASSSANATTSDSSVLRYKYYTSKFIASQTSNAVLDATNDCWVSDLKETQENQRILGSGNDTVTYAFYEGQWLQGSDAATDSLYVCQNNGTVGGAMFGVGHWHGGTQMQHSVISGRWETATQTGTMILKYVDSALVGTFLVGLRNVESQVQYALNPNGAPAKLARNHSYTPEGAQCIDMDTGFSGQWTESLHGQTLYLCAKRDGTLYGAYTREVKIEDTTAAMPIGVVRGKVDTSTKIATGTWYEAGLNQRGNFVWNLDSTTSLTFKGEYWSDDALVEGITVAGMDWSEKRKAWAASPDDCLENIYLLSNDSMEGFWSMPDFASQKHPTTGELFTNLQLTLCKDSEALSTMGIYHEKGDWQGNVTLDHSMALGYFKEHWTPAGVKIAGNVLFRMRHDNFSEAYHFEGEDNDISTIGHLRVHTRLNALDLSARNCTPVFPNGAVSRTIGGGVLLICMMVLSLVL